MTKHSAQTLKIGLQVAPGFVRLVNRTRLRHAVRVAFESAGEQRHGELTVVITGDEQIKELNRIYRGVDAPTDVLAFSDRDEEASGFIKPVGALYFGDILISYPRAVEQAAAYNHSIEEELELLVIHGVLHLLGYDHEQEGDKEKMWRVQSNALAKLGIQWQP